MHFHVPKPLHGWREFAGEVGIIVVGVLIALGAEQVVEGLRWRAEGHTAVQSLKVEMGEHFDEASEAMIVAPCVDRQLELLEQRLTRSGAYQPAALFHEPSQAYTVRAPSRLWADNAWRSVVSEGVVSHLDPELRMSLSDYYSQLTTMRENSEAGFLINQRLRVLAQPLQLDAATRARLVEEIEEDRGRSTFGALVGSQLLAYTRELHMTPPREQVDAALGRSGTIKFCRDHGLPLGNNTALY